ncbi:hypothetical protein MAPG_09552 [Magnaporthiopsis poae ATCC 64411]|uniref:Delta(24)-sterol reductase n=1 Tax=Magnaporthiopsis poae (strain ATCC 64411 / 73-15) TaxID=644358 RepID=A0A0C4EA93_MAGP6|nr:hypothetical protein MAPG_09552 [Magnaporthiopsis poae ATCC 64411]
MEAHNQAVAAIASRVRQFSERQQPFRIYHGSTNSTRRSDKRPDNTVDTSRLDHVLSVDVNGSGTVVAEPNVPMDALVAATLPHGLVPPVVMEFPGITVGGGFSGTSGESSSFRHGAFDATVVRIEIVLPTGEVAHASRTERPDLFWGAASAFGTLGVVTLLEVRLIAAKPFVELEYHLARSVADSVEQMRVETGRDDNDFVDGVVYSPDAVVICAGRMVDALPNGTSQRRFTRARDPWFYLHVEKHVLPRLRKPGPDGAAAKDYIPLTDYLFRYDRGGFWAARWAFQYFRTPFNRATRFALDPLMHTRVMYRALHKSGLSDFYMTQDVGVPLDKAPALAAWLVAEMPGIMPLWLCPLRLRRDGGPNAAHGLHSSFADPGACPDLLNFGIWGPLPSPSSSDGRKDVVRLNRALEAKVAELGGKKWLYAQAFYTEDEFWAHYDRASYDALRAKYGAAYLPSVYDKVKVDVEAEEAAARATRAARLKHRLFRVWPVRGLYGVYKALEGGDYLLQKTRRPAQASGK